MRVRIRGGWPGRRRERITEAAAAASVTPAIDPSRPTSEFGLNERRRHVACAWRGGWEDGGALVTSEAPPCVANYCTLDRAKAAGRTRVAVEGSPGFGKGGRVCACWVVAVGGEEGA